MMSEKNVKSMTLPHKSWLHFLICVIGFIYPYMPTEALFNVYLMVFFCPSNSTTEGPTATNRAMLPSLGQKETDISLYLIYVCLFVCFLFYFVLIFLLLSWGGLSYEQIYEQS